MYYSPTKNHREAGKIHSDTMNRPGFHIASVAIIVVFGFFLSLNIQTLKAADSQGDINRGVKDQSGVQRISDERPRHIFKFDGSSVHNELRQKPEYLRSSQSVGPDSTSENPKLASKKSEESPNSFKLKQNYPNPFNPATEIRYQLPTSKHVTLKVYDMLGRPVKTLVDENKEAGIYNVRFNAGGLSSGMYLYRLKAGDYEQIRKMILIK